MIAAPTYTEAIAMTIRHFTVCVESLAGDSLEQSQDRLRRAIAGGLAGAGGFHFGITPKPAPNADGGQAFPRAAGPEGASFCNGAEGMTLRDWFAGQVIVGVAAMKLTADRPPPTDSQFARFAYSIADALIAERAKG